jgi:hypothetical protein
MSNYRQYNHRLDFHINSIHHYNYVLVQVLVKTLVQALVQALVQVLAQMLEKMYILRCTQSGKLC